MKCPYQTIMTHKLKGARGYGVEFVEDITEFGECLKSECPFYYTKTAKRYNETYITEHCHKAESEINDNL
jgi:hypothetical protein